MADKPKTLSPIPAEIWDHLYVCGLCGFIHETSEKFHKHIRWYHRIPYAVYVVRVRYNRIWPLCSCGCGVMACEGFSVYKEDVTLWAKGCRKRHIKQNAEKKLGILACKLGVEARKHPLWRGETSKEAVMRNKLEILPQLLISGIFTQQEHDEATNTIVNQLKLIEAKRAKTLAEDLRYETQMNYGKRKKRKPQVEEAPSSRVSLGFDSENDLWKHVEDAVAKPDKKRSSKKKKP